MKNMQAKRREVDNPYEIWQSLDGTWEWRVLKKYQRPDLEATNEYARWLVAVKSPMTYGSWEHGDEYVANIKRYAIRVFAEPVAT